MDCQPTDCLKHAGVESDIRALKERVEYVVAAQEKALDVAKKEVDRRLEGMNNFQHRMDRQENLFATKVEVQTGFQTLYRLIWIGIGFFLALQIFLEFFISRVATFPK